MSDHDEDNEQDDVSTVEDPVPLQSLFGPFDNFNDVIDDEDEDRKSVLCIVEEGCKDNGPMIIASLFGPFPLLKDISPNRPQKEDEETRSILCELEQKQEPEQPRQPQVDPSSHNKKTPDLQRMFYEEKRFFGPFPQEIRKVPSEMTPVSREDEVRRLLSGKTLFGPFAHHPHPIETVPRHVQVKELTEAYHNMFPHCPRVYLDQKVTETVDDKNKQEAFIAALSATDGVPPTDWLETLEDGDLEMDSLWVRTYELHKYLIRTLPSICPDFLLRMVKTKCEEDVYKTVVDTFFIPKTMKTWPTREQYNQRKREEALVEEYLSVFNPEEIARGGYDPVLLYGDIARNVSKEYVKVGRSFLMREFRDIPRRDIKAAMVKCNHVFFASYVELQRFKGRKRKTMRPLARLPQGIEPGLMKEIQFARNAQNYEEYLKSRAADREQKLRTARTMNLVKLCAACFGENWLPEEMLTCPSGHWFCYECAGSAAQISVAESSARLMCFEGYDPWNWRRSCEEYFSLHNLQKVVEPRIFSMWLKKIQMEEAELAFKSGLATCPFCPYLAIYDQAPEKNRVFVCHNPECGKESCRLCNELTHLPLKCDEIEKSYQVRMRIFLEQKMTDAMLRHCNKCKRAFYKIEGCNKMSCDCGNSQCYICGINVRFYEHFSSDQFNTAAGKCPLHSDNRKLLEDEIRAGALLGKEVLEKQNPAMKLFIDPTKDVLKKADAKASSRSEEDLSDDEFD